MRYMVANRDEEKLSIAPHCCATLTLAEIVKVGLEEEFAVPCSIIEFPRKRLTLDFGGKLVSSWNMVEYETRRPDCQFPIIFAFYPHHLYSVITEFNKQLKDVRRSGFVRLVGERFVSCMYIEDARALFDRIKADFDKLKAEHDRCLEQYSRYQKNPNPYEIPATPESPVKH